jgi:hypothetical protein
MTLTLFILDHLLPFTIATALILVAVLAYGIGKQNGAGRSIRYWPHGAPLIRLDWIADIPTCEIVSDPATAADVAAWLEAVKEGAVLRV